MLDPWRVYTAVMHRSLRKFYATWLPSEVIKVGDIGYLEHDRFVKRGNLMHLGAPPVRSTQQTADSIIRFQSSEGLVLDTKADGPGAELHMSFNSESAVFFSAAGCVHHVVDALDLEPAILDMVRMGLWAPDYVVVHHVVTASTATIVFGGSREAHVRLRAREPVIDFARADLKLELGSHTNCALVLPSLRNCTPLIGALQIKRRHLVGQQRLVERSASADPAAAIINYRRARQEAAANNTFESVFALHAIDDDSSS